MDYQDLYDMRKKLSEWKKSPKEAINILKILQQQQLQKDALIKSKISKTIHKISIMQDDPDPLLISLKAVATALQDRINRLLQAQEIKEPIKEPLTIIKDDNQINGNIKSLPDIDLFVNHKVPYPAYCDRLKYLTRISKLFIYNLQNSNKINELSGNDYQNIKEIVEIIEKTIYYKCQQIPSARKAYEQDFKILVGFLQKDKSGSITYRIFTKQFDAVQAAQLKATDWVDDATKQEQARIIREKMEAEQIGFYKDLSKREMEGIEGKQCKGCGQKKVYLVDEKQTRASDEPTTKFFECYNCGDKFRIC